MLFKGHAVRPFKNIRFLPGTSKAIKVKLNCFRLVRGQVCLLSCALSTPFVLFSPGSFVSSNDRDFHKDNGAPSHKLYDNPLEHRVHETAHDADSQHSTARCNFLNGTSDLRGETTSNHHRKIHPPPGEEL